MAKRPVFVPDAEDPSFVAQLDVEFDWFPGFSQQQKQRSIASLHAEAKAKYELSPILEISSKSPDQIGIKLSAFNLFLEIPPLKQRTSVESVYQGSKLFEYTGPFTDLYEKIPQEAKKDIRLQNSGDLKAFQFGKVIWPIEPKTIFYDWLYLKALQQNPELAAELLNFKGFTDIEFNPKRSFNCQARSAALHVSLVGCDRLNEVLESVEEFKRFYAKRDTWDLAE